MKIAKRGYSESGEEQLNSSYILTEPAGLANRSDMGCDRGEKSKMTLKTFVLTNGRREPPSTEVAESLGGACVRGKVRSWLLEMSSLEVC